MYPVALQFEWQSGVTTVRSWAEPVRLARLVELVTDGGVAGAAIDGLLSAHEFARLVVPELHREAAAEI